MKMEMEYPKEISEIENQIQNKLEFLKLKKIKTVELFISTKFENITQKKKKF